MSWSTSPRRAPPNGQLQPARRPQDDHPQARDLACQVGRRSAVAGASFTYPFAAPNVGNVHAVLGDVD